MPDKPTQWLTTAGPPWNDDRGENGGQHGWKLHAVLADDKETFKGIGKRTAVCGLTPAWGWGLDLFIDDDADYKGEHPHRCKRCVRAIAKREASNDKHGNV